jgi:hypothetical protein
MARGRSEQVKKKAGLNTDLPAETLVIGNARVTVFYPDDDTIIMALGGNARLTDMTEDELDMFQSFVNKTIDRARPTVEKLDEQARLDEQDGVPNRRRYRPVPKVDRHNWPE